MERIGRFWLSGFLVWALLMYVWTYIMKSEFWMLHSAADALLIVLYWSKWYYYPKAEDKTSDSNS